MNFMRLITIFEAGLQGLIEFLASPFDSTNNNMFFREDSSTPSSNSSNDEDDISLGSIGNSWMEVEQTRRVLTLIDKKIREIGYKEDILIRNDWKSIISFDSA